MPDWNKKITAEEMLAHLEKLRQTKIAYESECTGPDEIPYCLLYHMGEAGLNCIITLFNKMCESKNGDYPESFGKFISKMVSDEGWNHFRRVHSSNHSAKCLAAVLISRLEENCPQSRARQTRQQTAKIQDSLDLELPALV